MLVGCDACYAEDPEAAWLRCCRGLERTVELVDESHFVIFIGRCSRCTQYYVSIFTEFVDWAGGEDAQHRTIVPVTAGEAAALADCGMSPDLVALGALGEDRRYLVVDWPTGARAKRIHWSRGRFYVVPGH